MDKDRARKMAQVALYGPGMSQTPVTRRSRLAEHLYETALLAPSTGLARSTSKSRSRAQGGQPATARPTLLVCYLCGQQFGRHSLGIHQPQCYVKRLLEWQKMDPALRGPKPRNPRDGPDPSELPFTQNLSSSSTPTSALEAFNDEQFFRFQQGLVPCPNCGRRFLPDRLTVHLRSCRAGASASKRPPRSMSAPRRTSSGGGGAGSAGGGSGASFPFSRNTPSDFDGSVETASAGKRESTPKGRAVLVSPLAAPSSDLSRDSPGSFTEDSVQCPKCLRKFNPKSAEKHIPNCHAMPVKTFMENPIIPTQLPVVASTVPACAPACAPAPCLCQPNSFTEPADQGSVEVQEVITYTSAPVPSSAWEANGSFSFPGEVTYGECEVVVPASSAPSALPVDAYVVSSPSPRRYQWEWSSPSGLATRSSECEVSTAFLPAADAENSSDLSYTTQQITIPMTSTAWAEELPHVEAPIPAPAPPGRPPKFCPQCGERFLQPCKFCPECGAKVAFPTSAWF
eukprot:RCo039005